MSLFVPRITFVPRMLAEVRDKILEEIPEHPIRERVARRAQGVDFEALLVRLRSTTADSVHRVAEDMSLAEVDTLSYRFPEIAPQDLAKRRATTVLLSRWRRRYGQMAWRQFQRWLGDPELPRLIKTALEKQQLPFSSSAMQRLLEAMSAEHPLSRLADLIQSAGGPFDTSIEELGITIGAPLYKELLGRYLITATADVYTRREKEDFVLNSWTMLAAESAESYPLVIDRYLTILSLDEFRAPMINNIFQRLGRPDRQGTERWQKVSEEAQQKYLKWLNLSEMRKFFESVGDNERFQFWALFGDVLSDVRPICIKDSKAAFLVFSGAVVVEFAKLGNAAYVYSRQRYDREFIDYATGRKQVPYESVLKDTSTSLMLSDANISSGRAALLSRRPDFCFRIVHSGSWQDRVYWFMRQIT